MAQIIRLPYSVTRGAHSRKPRRSKNGTPEEREAKRTPAASVCAISAGSSADPIFSLIEAHREATARHSAALREQERLDLAGDHEASSVAEEPCHTDFRTWRELVNTAPQTFAGLQAWVSYLDKIREAEGWMLEDRGQELVATLAEALGNLA